MVIFLLGEDRAYLSWITRHRNGFVLDWLRKPTRKKPTIHRATCAEIRASTGKATHWTTGRHFKACALDLTELVAWAREEAGGEPDCCETCRPAADTGGAAPADRHLTKLGKEIVDYVVEVAVIHLDRHDSGYEMTVRDVAECVNKTPAQISPALMRLAEDGFLRLERPAPSGKPLPAKCKVFPTSDALRMLSTFEKIPEQQVEEELEGLSDEA